MSCDQQFCLRWNNFQANITSQFEALRDQEDFVDVTLACEGRRLQAHKVVLSACSPYFKDLFKSNPCPHPIIFMRDCELIHITALLEFMYAGEVNISQAQLTAFLRTAEALQIRGLTDSPDKHKQELKNTSMKAQSSQLRNLLCGRLHQQTSNAKDSNQNTGSSNYQKNSKIISQSRKVLRSENKSHVISSQNGMSETAYSGLLSGSNNDYEMSDDGNRLKDNILLSNQDDENYDYNISENNSLMLNDNDNSSIGKINPFAVGNFSGLHTDFTHEMIEPKIEVPDYTSDDDTRNERSFNSDVLYNNDSPAHLSGNIVSIQGREVAASTSQSGKGEIEGVHQNNFQEVETSGTHLKIGLFEDIEKVGGRLAGAGRVCCPECGRRYSNLSNLRQHVRLIHRSQPVACPLCARSFKTQLYLRRHTLSQHSARSNVSSANRGVVPVRLSLSKEAIMQVKRDLAEETSSSRLKTMEDSNGDDDCETNGCENINGDISSESIDVRSKIETV